MRTAQNENGSISTNLNCDSEGDISQVYTYLWSDLDPSTTQSGNRDNLSAGNYCLTVTDEDGCSYEGCWEVESEVGEIPQVTLLELNNIPICMEGSDPDCTGSLTIEVPDGATIEWLNVPNSGQSNSPTVTDLCPGTYQVEVKIDGCGFTHPFDIVCCSNVVDEDDEQNTTPIDIELIEWGSASSSTANDGFITLSITGGSDEKVISWTGPGGFMSSIESISNLAPGSYTVNIDDGCRSESELFIIYDCSALNLSVSGSVTANTCQK